MLGAGGLYENIQFDCYLRFNKDSSFIIKFLDAQCSLRQLMDQGKL